MQQHAAEACALMELAMEEGAPPEPIPTNAQRRPALLSMPENLSRRVWFILDELDSLNELPSLSPGLQEGRKYGGCFVTGIQDSGQLLATYGDHRGSTIFGRGVAANKYYPSLHSRSPILYGRRS
jgi:hypothetical protein